MFPLFKLRKRLANDQLVTSRSGHVSQFSNPCVARGITVTRAHALYHVEILLSVTDTRIHSCAEFVQSYVSITAACNRFRGLGCSLHENHANLHANGANLHSVDL